jgi:hypothetical protein
MQRLLASVCVAGVICLAPLAHASDVSPGRGVPTVTRLVKLFMDLEQTLDQQLARGDKADLVADNFEQRNGSAPGNPVPRAEWLPQMSRIRLGEMSQMAVHDHGTLAVVSFLATRSGKSAFVVDVWKNQQGQWLLATRYVSGTAEQPVPPPLIPKKFD